MRNLEHLVIRPACGAWADRARSAPAGDLFGHPLAVWREKTRREVGLATGRPIVATGHQTLLWHPGILVKYLLMDAVARQHDLATANLIVDQHVGDFGAYEVPIRRGDGGLGTRRVELTRPRKDVPMSLHEPFTPEPPPRHLAAALPSVREGVGRIHEAIVARRAEPNAALQMAEALSDLMRPWVAPVPRVTAGDLVETSLARAIMSAMVADPRPCAEAYNEAIERSHGDSQPLAIRPLLVRDDYVELPLWRIREDGRRMHAYDGDVEAFLAGGAGAPRVMPRALFMTTLIRLGMCDLFIHGLGGATYDVAMERWIGDWLGVRPAPIAVATATLQLPLRSAGETAPDWAGAGRAARRGWHDPESADAPARSDPPGPRPGPIKRELLEAIADAPAGSPRRREAFFTMHRQLEVLRSVHAGAVERLNHRADEAKRWWDESEIADRRDWPFALYPPEMIDELAEAVTANLRGQISKT